MCDIIRCCHNADSAYLKPLPFHHFLFPELGLNSAISLSNDGSASSTDVSFFKRRNRRSRRRRPRPRATGVPRHGGTRSETSGRHRFSAPTFFSSRCAAMETVPMSVKTVPGASRFHRRTGAGYQKASTLTWPPFASCSPRLFLYCRLPGPTRFLLVRCFRDNIRFFF